MTLTTRSYIVAILVSCVAKSWLNLKAITRNFDTERRLLPDQSMSVICGDKLGHLLACSNSLPPVPAEVSSTRDTAVLSAQPLLTRSAWIVFLSARKSQVTPPPTHAFI